MSCVGDDSSGTSSGLEDPQAAESPHAPTRVANAPVRRSTRVAQRSGEVVPSIWPVAAILMVLFQNGISAPVNSTHEELYAFLLGSLPDLDITSPPVLAPPAPVAQPKGRKRAMKRKNVEPNPTEPGVSGAHGVIPMLAGSSAASPAVSTLDPVLAALEGIQRSVVGIDARLRALESGPVSASSVPVSGSLLSAPAAAFPASPAPVAALNTLKTALPAPSSGSSFLSPSASITPALRESILAGKDVNLVKILISSTEGHDCRLVEVGDVAVVLKDNDTRLTKSLSMPEFVTAFSIYRDVICEVFPNRRTELDTYLAINADLAMTYGGTLFYEYHKSFSSKAAMYVSRFNILVDWSVVDLGLISRLFTGRQALSCSICGSFTHTSGFCPRTAAAANVKAENARPSAPSQKSVKEPTSNVCIRFNEAVCTYSTCKFMHICSYCSEAHPRAVCPRRSGLRKKVKKN